MAGDEGECVRWHGAVHRLQGDSAAGRAGDDDRDNDANGHEQRECGYQQRRCDADAMEVAECRAKYCRSCGNGDDDEHEEPDVRRVGDDSEARRLVI